MLSQQFPFDEPGTDPGPSHEDVHGFAELVGYPCPEEGYTLNGGEANHVCACDHLASEHSSNGCEACAEFGQHCGNDGELRRVTFTPRAGAEARRIQRDLDEGEAWEREEGW
jgi:hypothetical protein